MNLQNERMGQLCDNLSLPFIAQGYGAAVQKAAKEDISYSDFLEGLLREEVAGRTVRKQSMMTRLAGFPVIKTLDGGLRPKPRKFGLPYKTMSYGIKT